MRTSILISGIYLLTLLACDSDQMSGSNPFLEGNAALWIEDGIPLPDEDSLFYLDHPASMFRKTFETMKPVESASLIITAAGYYKVAVNGNGIEDNVLDPAWTDFSKRIYYSEYDVTSMLQAGNNCIGVVLGNGFYNPLPLRKWGRRNLRNDLSVGKPVFIAKLQIKYRDGSLKEIVTDESWKHKQGPIIRNSVYIGVLYNAGKEIEAWNMPSFNDSTWNSVKIGSAPGGQLEKAYFPPVEITREITPKEIYSPSKGTYVVDMGVNFTGAYRIKLSGNLGDTISFKFGERVYNDGNVNPMTSVIGQIKRKGIGGPGAPEIAYQTDSYIIGKEGEAWFMPDFTYHTYRYMEIEGLDQMPSESDVVGLVMHSDVPNENTFESSSDLLNSIQEITERTFLTNLVSVQSDCPAREKFGYGGDLNATSESFIYNFDMQSFYRKSIYDWVDAMNDSSFVDTAPYTGIAYCGISWESAYLTTQYYLYLYYNDLDIVKELYPLNQKWMEKAARLHPEGIVNEGLSDHESLEPVPVQLTGTSHYLQCARIMQTFASLMENDADVQKYKALEEHLVEVLKSTFWDQAYTEDINRQTLFSTLLYHKIIPSHEIHAATDSLLKAIENGPSQHLNTGIFGTKYSLETLAKYGTKNAVFDIVNSKDYPGWGYMLEQGATTIWETWKESDNTYSNNHPMFGTVTEWYYRWLAGIRPDPEHPGFKEFFLTPTTPDGLDSIACTYHSPFGPIVSKWKAIGPDQYTFEITVPPGSKANVTLPKLNSQKIELKTREGEKTENEIKNLESGQFILDSGSYMIELAH